MAEKKPLCNYGGHVKELASGDTLPGATGPSYAVLSSDHTTTSATLADVSGLSFSVVSGNVYRFKFQLVVTTNAATTGFSVGLTVPSTTTLAAMLATFSSTSSFGSSSGNHATINASQLSINNGSLASGQHPLTIEGVIKPSANGTVQLQFATETVTTTNATIKQGSFVEYQAI